MAKFKKLKIEANVEDVVTSALGAAQYVVNKYGKGPLSLSLSLCLCVCVCVCVCVYVLE
jgi:hypothetical protein